MLCQPHRDWAVPLPQHTAAVRCHSRGVGPPSGFRCFEVPSDTDWAMPSSQRHVSGALDVTAVATPLKIVYSRLACTAALWQQLLCQGCQVIRHSAQVIPTCLGSSSGATATSTTPSPSSSDASDSSSESLVASTCRTSRAQRQASQHGGPCQAPSLCEAMLGGRGWQQVAKLLQGRKLPERHARQPDLRQVSCCSLLAASQVPKTEAAIVSLHLPAAR